MDDMILCIGNPNESIRMLETISEYSKVSENQISIAFLYSNIEISEKEAEI